MAFGDVTIDAIGRIRDTPSASLITGLLANALGVRREETARLARLQERLVFGCRLDRRGHRFTEFQTAKLAKSDVGWTTRGYVEGREGGERTYDSPHIRYRDHDADARVTVALRLLDEAEAPTLDDLARALDEPSRPLFVGRKPCLPSGPLVVGFDDAPTVFEALHRAPGDAYTGSRRAPRIDETMLVVLPADEPCPEGFRAVRANERRDWEAGVHAGQNVTWHGYVRASQLSGRAN